MKKILASILSLGLIAISCTFPSPTPESTPLPDLDPSTIDWDDRSIYRAGLVPSAQPVLDALAGASVYHMDLDLADDLLSLTGTLNVRYTNTENVLLNEIQFRLFPNILGGTMQISNLRVDESPADARYDLNNSLMIVPLVGGLQPGENIIVHMDFSVEIPDSLDLNYGVLAYAEGVLALAHAYPMISVYDDEGWNAEIPSQDGDLIYADSSFYRVRVLAPKGLTLVTSGVEIDRLEAGQDQVLTVAAGPTRDFYLAASSVYQELSQDFGDYTIRSYAPSGFEHGSQTAVEIAARAVEIFSTRYAQFPYTELDIVATPTRALGIEYPGIVAITSWTYDISDEITRNYLESTVVHEVGHQWFYNLIGSDQLDDPWLDEALTQFVTLQYYADEYGAQGEEGFIASLESRWARVEYSTIPIGLPVARYSGVEYGAIVYGRGPLFFVELRKSMGSEAFDAFLREYTGTLAWEEATPEILQSLAEKNCSCDLDVVFNDWVYLK
ncbi:MAG TPA: M1 family metallopeptidase [Anaerolineales bacterium]|nr:M1 family metallopeptidase [Anaerolineales bacterium]